ncbi:MAG: class I SAM-dependent methyltransferase [Acidimicrobiia bacterium]
MTRESWNQRYQGSDLVWSAAPNAALVGEVSGMNPGRALDLGCGEGRNSIWLAEQGWDVTGVDFSNVAIERARAIAAQRGVSVKWEVADLNEYEPPRRWFDLVVDLYIHLIPSERRTLTRKAAGAVAEGGTLVILGHDKSNLDEGYGGPQDLTLLHDPEEIAGELTDLTVVRSGRIRRKVETEEGSVEAIDSLVRATRKG